MLIHSPKELALLVSDQRKKHKKSQASIGNAVGLKQATISAFENKPGSTQLDTLFKILSAANLNLSISAKHESSKNKATWKEEW